MVVGAAEGHAGQVASSGMSGNTENGSHLAEADAAESYARLVEGPGSSGNARIGSHIEAIGAADGKTVHARSFPPASVMTGGPAGPSTQCAHDRPTLPDPVGRTAHGQNAVRKGRP